MSPCWFARSSAAGQAAAAVPEAVRNVRRDRRLLVIAGIPVRAGPLEGGRRFRRKRHFVFRVALACPPLQERLEVGVAQLADEVAADIPLVGTRGDVDDTGQDGAA